MTTYPDSAILTGAIALLRQREKDGHTTHGTTVDRTDYSLLRWLKESQEEKADDLMYMGAAIRVATALIDERDRLREALKELLIDVSIAQSNMRQAAKYDHKWEGCSEAIQSRVDIAREALQESVA